MARIKSAAGVVLIMLLLFFSSNREGRAFMPTTFPICNIAAHSSVNSKGPGTTVNYPSIKKDWIKVRYIGGEYYYNVPHVPMVVSSSPATKPFPIVYYPSFVSSSLHFLLALRGPPQVSIKPAA